MNVEKLRRKVESITDVAMSLDDAITGLINSEANEAVSGLLKLARSSLIDTCRDIEDFIKENKKEEK